MLGLGIMRVLDAPAARFVHNTSPRFGGFER